MITRATGLHGLSAAVISGAGGLCIVLSACTGPMGSNSSFRSRSPVSSETGLSILWRRTDAVLKRLVPGVHRGQDDVRNLCRLALELAQRGAVFEPTWGKTEAAAEHARRRRKADEARDRLEHRTAARQSLPDSVGQEVREVMDAHIAKLHAELIRREAEASVFDWAQ